MFFSFPPQFLERACHPNPCKNGGTCDTLPQSGWKCKCTEGWKGSTCEEEGVLMFSLP